MRGTNVKKKTTTTTLSIRLSDEPPNEFRLFVAGDNATEHGTFVFDDEAARLVMAAAEKKGTDYPIDLEHQMLDPAATDPTARDARGWFGLEVRDGELWATGVRWTPDGEMRLREKRQRYVSPAFDVETKTKRITRIINVAITSLPATHSTPALIAASTRGKKKNMKTTKKTTSALLEGAVDDPSAEALLQIAEMLVHAGFLKVTPSKAAEVVEAVSALAEEPAEEEEEEAPAVPETDAEATLSILRLTSAPTLRKAATEIANLTRDRIALAAERDELMSAERIRLCRAMVVEGGIAPAKVWNQTIYKPGETPVPKPFLQRMTLSELRDYSKEQIEAVPPNMRPRLTIPNVTPPVSAGGGVGGRTVMTSRGAVEIKPHEIAMLHEPRMRVGGESFEQALANYAEMKVAEVTP